MIRFQGSRRIILKTGNEGLTGKEDESKEGQDSQQRCKYWTFPQVYIPSINYSGYFVSNIKNPSKPSVSQDLR